MKKKNRKPAVNFVNAQTERDVFCSFKKRRGKSYLSNYCTFLNLN